MQINNIVKYQSCAGNGKTQDFRYLFLWQNEMSHFWASTQWKSSIPHFSNSSKNRGFWYAVHCVKLFMTPVSSLSPGYYTFQSAPWPHDSEDSRNGSWTWAPSPCMDPQIKFLVLGFSLTQKWISMLFAEQTGRQKNCHTLSAFPIHA